MLKFFDIIGNRVVIHPDALALPPFKRVWEEDTEDKIYANKLISYIVLKNRYDSPFFKLYSTQRAEEILKREYFGTPDYILTDKEKQVEKDFKELQHTVYLELLEGMLLKLQTFAVWYRNSLDEELDGTIIGKHLSGMKNVEATIVSIEKTIEKIKADELTSNKNRSKYEISRYELPENV